VDSGDDGRNDITWTDGTGECNYMSRWPNGLNDREINSDVKKIKVGERHQRWSEESKGIPPNQRIL